MLRLVHYLGRLGRGAVPGREWAPRGQGLGRRLVEACVSDAVTFGIYKVFALTYQVAFFRKLGFDEVSKTSCRKRSGRTA